MWVSCPYEQSCRALWLQRVCECYIGCNDGEMMKKCRLPVKGITEPSEKLWNSTTVIDSYNDLLGIHKLV